MSLPPVPESQPPEPSGPTRHALPVTAVLVVTDGAEWLPGVLATLAAQGHPDLSLVVVDNASTDSSPALLARRIPAARLVTLPRRVGFGRAVDAGLACKAFGEPDFVLLVHDDLALAPDAVEALVQAMVADPELSIVGPKLREWGDDPILQAVGTTIDRFGRAETLLEPGERDQGQQDRQREVLYVSTAGMLLRAGVLSRVGGFDARFRLFRDDLDLCWRAWLLGERVEVVPAAVGYHVAAASRRLRRLGRGYAWEGRELAERHSVATLLKCYGPLRLAWVVPLLLLLAAGKIAGFLVTRRFGDALAVVRAYGWNLLELPRTLRRRRALQRRRTATDADVARLFAPGLPRVRAYVEAGAAWVAGGGTRALLEDTGAQETAEATGGPREDQSQPAAVRQIRRHPVASAAVVLAIIYLVGLAPLLGSGQLVGGRVAPWPVSPLAFLRSFASPWSGEPLASGAPASPIQAVLGVTSFAGLGSAWLAQRIVVLGLLPLAWFGALRAARLITVHRAPRVLGATLYALSPVVLGALGAGLFDVLVVAALFPALVALGARTVAPTLWQTGPAAIASAWRSAALLALTLAIAVSAAPRLWPLFALYGAVVMGAALVRREGLGRLGVAALGVGALLAPWVAGMLREGWTPPAPGEAVSLPLWRALTAVPDVLPGLGGLGGILVAVPATAAVAAALLLALRGRPGVVGGFAAVLVVSSLGAWTAARVGGTGIWTPALLLPSALAQAGLGVVAARWIGRGLREHAFGGRQLAVVVSVVLLGIGLVVGLVRLGSGPYPGLARAPELLPPFIGADEPRVGPYRVLLLHAADGEVRFDVVGASGPSMLAFGALQSRTLRGAIESSVVDIVGGSDPGAAARLGVVGVRYVVVGVRPDTDTTGAAQLVTRLDEQPSLSPVPSGSGRVYRVDSWLPRAVILPTATGESLLATGDPGNTAAIAESGMTAPRLGAYSGVADPLGGLLVISEASAGRWQAFADGVALQRRRPEPDAAAASSWAVNGFTVPAAATRILAVASGTGHRLGLLAQAGSLLALISLALRPPRTHRGPGGGGRGQGDPEATLPAELAARPPPAPVGSRTSGPRS